MRIASIFALGSRGDASAIPAMEALLKSNDLSIEMAPMIKRQIEMLKNPGKGGGGMGDGRRRCRICSEGRWRSTTGHLEQLVEEMNERLKTIEARLPPAPKQ